MSSSRSLSASDSSTAWRNGSKTPSIPATIFFFNPVPEQTPSVSVSNLGNCRGETLNPAQKGCLNPSVLRDNSPDFCYYYRTGYQIQKSRSRRTIFFDKT